MPVVFTILVVFMSRNRTWFYVFSAHHKISPPSFSGEYNKRRDFRLDYIALRNHDQ